MMIKKYLKYALGDDEIKKKIYFRQINNGINDVNHKLILKMKNKKTK